MLAVEMKDVIKNYFRTPALRGINLQIVSGRLVGLLGPNGAGKSTLLKMCAGLTHPTSGQVLIKGNRVSKLTKKTTAFIPENDTFYPGLSVKQALALESAMFGDLDTAAAAVLLDELKLNPAHKITTLSKGQRARLKLVLAMSRSADLILMDEPLAGIDPPSRAAILQTIAARYRAGEQSLIISTHEVSESEALFEDVIFIAAGEIVLTGNADELRATHGKSLNDIFAEVC